MAEKITLFTLSNGADRIQRTLRVALIAAILLAALAPLTDSTARDFPTTSVIIQGASVEQLAALVQSHGGEITARLPIIQGVAAMLSASALNRLQGNALVTRITRDRPVRLESGKSSSGGESGSGSSDGEEGGQGNVPNTDYPEVVNANYVWAGGNYGSGVTVAILDTGIGNHRGLTRDMNGNKRDIVWADMIGDGKKYGDSNGHGSHVAGIIANTQVGPDGTYGGVAPGVNLVGVRVLGEDGSGTYTTVIKGLQWVVDNQARYNIRIVNLSLYAPAFAPYWVDPLDQAVTAIWASGITVVAAAGNTGPNPLLVGVPGNNPYVITVGAFTDNFTPLDWTDDYVPPFSAAGPTLDAFVKPDVLAPGGHITSTMLPSTSLAKDHPELQASAQYFSMAGTSQATAVVSGIAALVLSAQPGLTPDQVKYRIVMGAVPQLNWDTGESYFSVFQQGAGRVSAPDAVLGTDLIGSLNSGMDIQADLAGSSHYQGPAYFDAETGLFRLRGLDGLTPTSFTTWAGGPSAWAGGVATWTGGYTTWAGGPSAWAGGPSAWAGGPSAWAGGYTTWAGGPSAWAGGPSAWAGGPSAWAGGPSAWAGGPSAWAGGYTTWAGGPSAWAGGPSAWAGGPSAWAGGPSAWAGGPSAWAGSYGDPDFASAFANLATAPSSTTQIINNLWVGP